MSETLTKIFHSYVPQGIFTQVQLSEVWIANENRGKVLANSLWAFREKAGTQPEEKKRWTDKIGHFIILLTHYPQYLGAE